MKFYLKTFLFAICFLLNYSCNNNKDSNNFLTKNNDKDNSCTTDTTLFKDFSLILKSLTIPSDFVTQSFLDKNILQNKNILKLSQAQIISLFKDFQPHQLSKVYLINLFKLEDYLLISYYIEGLNEDSIVVNVYNKNGDICDDVIINNIYREDFITNIDGKDLISTFEKKIFFDVENLCLSESEKEFFYNTNDTSFENTINRYYKVDKKNGQFILVDKKVKLIGKRFHF